MVPGWRWMVLASFLGCSALAAAEPELSLRWVGPRGERKLKSWPMERLRSELKPLSRKEADPYGGELVQWDGVSLFALVEKVVEELSNEERSQTDQIMLRKSDGSWVMMPRFLAHKYPLMIAFRREGAGLGSRGPFAMVVPWTTTKITEELLPIRKYALSGLTEVVLTQLKTHVSEDFFLNSRADPLTARGEKRFFQTCLGCHQTLAGFRGAKEILDRFEGEAVWKRHQTFTDMPKLEGIELRSIHRYMQAIRDKKSQLAVRAR